MPAGPLSGVPATDGVLDTPAWSYSVQHVDKLDFINLHAPPCPVEKGVTLSRTTPGLRSTQIMGWDFTVIRRFGAVPAMARAGVDPVSAGVAPGRGVAPAASGCGVAAAKFLGVTPLKSESWICGFSPPSSGVCPCCRRLRFCASIMTLSWPPADTARGVRMGVANLQADAAVS